MSPEEIRFRALGTTCHLVGLDLKPGRLAAAAADVLDLHARLSRFEPGSELSRLNRGAGSWVEVSPAMASVLAAAMAAWRDSGGLVHAGVLPSMLAIGYTRPFEQGPTAAVLERAAPPPPLPEMLELSAGRARLRAGTGIDLGGIAKGWMADRLAAGLGGDCVVNLGGDLFARGAGPEGIGWPVGLGGTTVLLRDHGAATSGTGRRRWWQGDRVLHHLVDPRTGLPAAGAWGEVSVVAESAAAAEAAAKTALLLEEGPALAHLAGHALAWWTR